MKSIADEARELEVSRILILCGPHAARGDTVKRAVELLGSLVAHLFDRVQPHAPEESIAEILDIVLSKKIDAIVAVGGGSTSDTAKAVATVIGEGRPLIELTTEFRPPNSYIERWLKKPKLPIIAIPGTLSGAETGPRFAFTGKDKIKRICGGDFISARVLILDPTATLDTDIDVFLRSGMNGLAHAIEGMYSKRRNPIADAASMECIKLFSENLPALVENSRSLDLRMQLLYASYLGSLVLASSRMCIHHAICHVLGARLGFSHGDANAMMLPYAMRFNLNHATEAIARAARAMPIEVHGLNANATAEKAIDFVFDLGKRIRAPSRLRDVLPRISRNQIERVASDVMIERGIHFNPRPITDKADVLALLEQAL